MLHYVSSVTHLLIKKEHTFKKRCKRKLFSPPTLFNRSIILQLIQSWTQLHFPTLFISLDSPCSLNVCHSMLWIYSMTRPPKLCGLEFQRFITSERRNSSSLSEVSDSQLFMPFTGAFSLALGYIFTMLVWIQWLWLGWGSAAWSHALPTRCQFEP